ncbi:helix-turn-helix domain-containing protein [Aliamphritea ceti]|uniref:helix-turn-helix domain-containing protein n=1 Tax=Aliamphritea ceti TaxID=1524258 RepID=UPI0021C3722E|nr:helix-turn-helix transcriptional regulator [Aliamphritea ceti]
MSPEQELGGLFSALRQVLKAQGIRYRDLASMLNTSEVTIKRLFQEQDCKMSRLLDICEAIGVSVADLLKLAEQAPSEPATLPLETEQVLAEQPGLFSCLILLLSGFDARAIGHYNQLSSADVYLYMRKLEKLQLVRIGVNDSVHLVVNMPIRWRLDGPLHQTLVEVNQAFIAQTISAQHQGDYPFYSTSRLFSPHSIRQLKDDIDKLYQRYQQQASLDQMFYPPEALEPFKMVTTMAPFNVPEFFAVPPYQAVIKHLK